MRYSIIANKKFLNLKNTYILFFFRLTYSLIIANNQGLSIFMDRVLEKPPFHVIYKMLLVKIPVLGVLIKINFLLITLQMFYESS